MCSAQYATAEWEIGKALKQLVKDTEFYEDGNKLVLSKHWYTALKHGSKMYNQLQCIKHKLGDIMNDYGRYKDILKPTLKEESLFLVKLSKSIYI